MDQRIIPVRTSYPLALLFVLGLLLPSAGGADWPQFRGPTGQGHVTGGMPLEWSETRNVTWKVPIPGLGWSSPVVAQGKVYLTTAVNLGPEKQPDYSLRALCVDAQTGKILWNVEVFREKGADAPRIHRKNSHASPTPIVGDHRLFVHFGHQGTACLDLEGKSPLRGGPFWKKQLTYRPVHGNGGTPILAEGRLVFSCDGARQRFVIALDAESGKEQWRTHRDVEVLKKFSFSTPLLLTVNEQQQVISPGSNMVAGYDLETGKEIWRVRYDGYSVVPKPVAGLGLVFVITGFDSPRLLAIRPTGTGDVTNTHVVWQQRQGVPLTPSLLLVGEELYMVSNRGIASCVNARTGTLYWRQRLPGDYSASPVDASGRIYFTSEEGITTVVAAGKEFKQLARNTVEGRTLASPAVVDGVLFLRTDTHLYRIEEKAR
jgi:outer membrane protein assembly factor BamB